MGALGPRFKSDAVRGEEVRKAGAAIEAWLRRIGLLGE
jgi:hypothetical protein